VEERIGRKKKKKKKKKKKSECMKLQSLKNNGELPKTPLSPLSFMLQNHLFLF